MASSSSFSSPSCRMQQVRQSRVGAQRAATCTRAVRNLAPTAETSIVAKLVDMMFRFPPLFDLAAKGARSKIVKRAEQIGISWEDTIKQRKEVDWAAEMEGIVDKELRNNLPQYWLVPFHAYKDGHNTLQAAIEEDIAAASVHAPLFAPPGEMERDGDSKMRASYTAVKKELLGRYRFDMKVDRVVDFGCSTGLSARELERAWPAAREVVGVEVSPAMVTVGAYLQRQREGKTGDKERLRFLHADARHTGLEAGSVDLVSMCLVAHETPQFAMRELAQEAMRILRPGGAFCIMEQDPNCDAMRRITDNVVAYTAFKSTEPYLDEYLSLDLHGMLRSVGFEQSGEKQCTPRHKAVVAIKKA